MLFEAEYTADRLDYLSFVRINRYIRGRIPRRLLTGAVAAVGALLLLLCILLTVRGAWTSKNIIIVAIGVILIGWELRRDKFNANENRRRMANCVDPIHMRADDTGIDIVSGDNVEHVDYNRIAEIYHAGESLLLYVADERAYIIPDDAFTTGTAADFAAFVAEKCGKSIIDAKV